MSDRKTKELNARRRACLDGDVTHIRCMDWFGDPPPDESPITVIGDVHELHGTVCTCCPRREPA